MLITAVGGLPAVCNLPPPALCNLPHPALSNLPPPVLITAATVSTDLTTGVVNTDLTTKWSTLTLTTSVTTSLITWQVRWNLDIQSERTAVCGLPPPPCVGLVSVCGRPEHSGPVHLLSLSMLRPIF